MTNIHDVESLAATEVTRLRATFATGRTLDLDWRFRQLDALIRMLEEGEDAIATALASDLGRSPGDAFMGDVMPPLSEAKFAAKHLKRWVKPTRVSIPLAQRPGKGWYEYEPLGVVFIIGPWNYPVHLVLAPLVGAIAAGNCAILKPSEHTPAAAQVLADLVPRYLDPDAFSVILGGAEATQDVLAQGVDHAFFTGGPEIGKAIMAAAAPHLTPVTLELGGKCPAVVAADADLGVAARRIAWTKLLNSGQTCVAPDYLLVDRAVKDRFVDLLKQTVADMSPTGDGGQAMPIVSRRHAERLAHLLEGHGGTVLHGGGAAPADRAVDMTLVDEPRLDSPLMQEEIFGPILPIVSVDSVDDAIGRINQGPKPLAAYIFTRSQKLARRYGKQVPAGSIVANHAAVQVLAPNLPFGGVGNSGMGAYHGKWGFEVFSHRKAYLSRSHRVDPAIIYPPYSEFTQKLMRKLF
ncbi:MAG TPA: aldehyde dehydrogenase family protein [Aeromicrobium sp.]|nr:aldehyde dehydrogenase family protein [Aeromicrobium sp.]